MSIKKTSSSSILGPYIELFKGREDCFAQQGEDWYFPVKRTLDEFYLQLHLEGNATFGLYLLNQESCCHLVCIDIDIPKDELSTIDLKSSEAKYDLLKYKLVAVQEVLTKQLGVPPESILFEDTGGRGYHIWLFLSKAIQGQTAVAFGAVLNNLLDFDIEFFPKQGHLTSTRKYGNLIKLPLGIHRKYGFWSYFFLLTEEGPQPIAGTEECIDHLQTLVPMLPEVIDQAIKGFEDELQIRDETVSPTSMFDQKRPQFDGNPTQLISQCTAIHSIRIKAEQGERLSRDEAFLFADVMLSVSGGNEFIHNTMHLSLKSDYNKDKTNDEIERIIPLFPPNCQTLVKKGICPDYCKESVRKRNEDTLVPGTSPCSVWFMKARTKLVADTENLLERIGSTENLKRAYFQLRNYHEHEDALFFDPFDFEHLESRFDSYSEVLAKILIEKINFPFDGYFSVSLPKKLNEEKELEFRQMSYSTVYDQLPIQAIFNILSPIIESEFQSTSYGYRWNRDSSTPYRIFEDWREAYPRFRNDILSDLKRYPKGFYVCCDIKGFYDHIDHDILLELIRKFKFNPYIYQMIERIIRAYESTEQSGHGLPQGPAYARLLANMYLNNFDIFAGKLGLSYFRYVDDFVLIFENERSAEEGLELVVNRLLKQGLDLAQDETKKATIEPNINISRVRKTLDKIHYGILEGTRHVEHLVPEAVEDFLDAVGRHSVSPVTLEQLIQINDVLPSLLYVVTKKSMFPHPLKPKVFAIIEFLVQSNWFCPKKLKTIFYRLLELESDINVLYNLFLSMNPIHKVYFLLSVFGLWKTHKQHLQLLANLVKNALSNENEFLWGFAILIATKIGVAIDSTLDGRKLFQKLSRSDGYFGLLKWITTINYVARPDDERAKIRELVSPESSDLVKMLLFTNITHSPTDYVDGIYLDNLLQDSGVMLLPSVCGLLVSATDKGEFFDSLLNFVVSQLVFKQLVVSQIKKGISDRRALSGLAEIENLKSLYDNIADDEIKQAMQSSLSRIEQYGLSCDEEFAKLHKLIDRYNGCFLFEMIEKEASYNYLELIPEGTLFDHIRCELDTFKNLVEDFGSKSILPTSSFVYDSGKREVRLKFKPNPRYRVLNPNEFSLTPESIQRACVLAADVYKKACYFQRFTGKAPHISPENLLIDSVSDTAVFRTIGRSLRTLHVFEGKTVGDEESDIAMMISILLEALFFKTKDDEKEFMKEKTHTGMMAFLALFLKNMKAKEPSHRYSYSRFEYLVDKMIQKSKTNKSQILESLVYLRENLKGRLFRYNSKKITWHGICRALNDHLSTHIRLICNRSVLQDFPFRSRVPFMGQGKRQLHTLSQYLLDLALSREDLTEAERLDAPYLDLVEFLLHYALVCVEIVAIGKTLRNTKNLQSLSSSPILALDRVKIQTDGCENDLTTLDLLALVIQESDDKDEGNITDMSLYQLAVQCLFACEIRFNNDFIEVKKPDKMRNEVFQKFGHACLVRIPNIESMAEKELQKVFFALRSNEDFPRLGSLEQIRKDAEILVHDLKQLRKEFCLKRHRGRASGKYFPPKIHLRSLFRRTRSVNKHTLPGCALTNSFPSKRDGYACSWDLYGSIVTNLMIPSEGVNSLMNDLKMGKFFGFKFTFIYSGKSMIFWDVPIFILNVALLVICDISSDSASVSTLTKGLFNLLPYFLGPLAVSLLFKIIYDLGHWMPWLRRLYNYIREQLPGNKDSK